MKSSLGGASIREQVVDIMHRYGVHTNRHGIDYTEHYPAQKEYMDEMLTLIESITKEVIGKDEVPLLPRLPGNAKEWNEYHQVMFQTQLRAEQRERLAQLLGEKK